MKINYAIMSSDNNSLYLDFWPYVSKIWKLKFNIEPILLYIDDYNYNVSNEHGIVINFHPCKDYPKYIQSLFIRYWYACTLKNNISIISDIDMFPISKSYFIDSISLIDEHKYVHINPCKDTYSLIPSCYHIAKGDVFKDVLKMSDSFENSLGLLKKNSRAIDEKCQEYWFSDEIFATERIAAYEDRDIFEFIHRDGGQSGHRIDRSRWRYDLNLFKKDYYWDAHMIRPVEKYKDEIQKITNAIVNMENGDICQL